MRSSIHQFNRFKEGHRRFYLYLKNDRIGCTWLESQGYTGDGGKLPRYWTWI